MDLSAIGEAVLITREGRVLKAYRDSVGIWTIGVGITTASGLITVTPGLTISAAQSDALFAQAIQKYVRYVRDGLRVDVPQHAFDALVSLVYNIGPGAFAKSTFLKRINAGDMAGARDAILFWNKPAFIITRRQAEAEQFVTPYAQAMPRATKKAAPIKVAAPIADILSPAVRTPVIPPVTVKAAPNWLARFGAWIDATWGDGDTARARPA